MYIPKYFTADELVPPKVFNERGHKSFELIDDRMLITIDALRARFGPIIINDYSWGGEREWSGLRTSDSPYYRAYSQHTFGRAMDMLFDRYDAKHVRRIILNDKMNPAFRFITAVEAKVNWLHADTRNTDRIMVFNP